MALDELCAPALLSRCVELVNDADRGRGVLEGEGRFLGLHVGLGDLAARMR